jgi:hypothetical protein
VNIEADSIFRIEDGGRMFLPNVGIQLEDYTACSSENLACVYKTTWCHYSGDHNLENHCHKKIKV